MKKVQILHSLLIGALLAMVAFLSVLAYRQARLNKDLSDAVMTLQRIEYDRLKTEQTKDREGLPDEWAGPLEIKGEALQILANFLGSTHEITELFYPSASVDAATPTTKSANSRRLAGKHSSRAEQAPTVRRS